MKMDKFKHFIVGLILSVTILINPTFSILFCSGVFIGKEVYDTYKPKPTNFGWLDLIFDYIGYFIGTLIILIST